MHKLKLFLSTAATGLSLSLLQAQVMPVKIDVAAVSSDLNQQFGVVHFSAISADKFSILYYQEVKASVMAPNEFVKDSGEVAYSDKKKKDPIPYSDGAMLLVKQTVNKDGSGTTEQVWLLAKRKMESSDGYTLYFHKKYKHPIVKSHTPITLTVYNIDAVTGLNPSEREALTTIVRREFLPPDPTYVPVKKEQTLAEGLSQMKSSFKSLRKTGILFKGDLPKSEDVLSRFTLTKDKSMAVTRTKPGKGKPFTLKFYLTADFATFSCVDTVQLDGSLDLTSVATVTNKDAQIAGALVGFVLKTKDAAGVENSKILTFLLNQDDEIVRWDHSVGKNKLSSYAPKLAWYEGNDLMVLATNNEKAFKATYMLHKFIKGKDPVMLYPATEEEKGSEKFKFAKMHQPEAANGVGAISPLAEKDSVTHFYNVNGTLYIITQGSRRDQATNTTQYLALTSYRISEDNKFTNTDEFSEYKSNVPARMDLLAKTSERLHFMLYYANKVELTLDKAQATINPIETPTFRLVTLYNGESLVKTDPGTMLLGKSPMGTKYTLWFYPAN